MQAVASDSAQSTPQDEHQSMPQMGIVMTVEFLLYALLIIGSLLFHLAELDSVPMSPVEIPQALTTYRTVIPDASGVSLDNQSPSVFLAQSVGMTIFGGTEFGARLFTALAGIGLIATPLLFRESIGQTRAFAIAVMLTFSPILFIASRASSGMIWALLFCAIALWGMQRFWMLRRAGADHASTYGAVAMVGFAGMIFLSDAGGVVLAMIVLGAILGASFFTAMGDPDDNDELMQADRFNWASLLQHMPWTTGVLASFITVLTVSTIFMLYPFGLDGVGGVLEGFLTGITESEPDTPALFPLVTTIFYEPWLLLFGGITIFVLIRRIAFSFIERFFVLWLAGGLFASLIFQGGMADHALWMVIPLIGLTSYLVTDALKSDDSQTLWIGDFLDDARLVANSAYWGKWILSFVIFALFVVLSLHFQIISRGFLQVADGSVGGLFERFGDTAFRLPTNSTIWLLITALFISVAYLFGASIWGNVTTLRAFVLGGVGFMLFSGVGTGWNVSVSRAHSPTELWHTSTMAENALTLRSVLNDFALRETQGEPDLPITVLAKDDGLLAWLLRDYTNTTFISQVESAYFGEIVILPVNGDTESTPDLGASYVGQTFTIGEDWQLGNTGFDFVPWWATRDVRFPPFPTLEVILWVRQDIYDSEPYREPLPIDPNSRG